MAELIPTTPQIPAGAFAQALTVPERRRVDPFESQKAFGEQMMAQAVQPRPLRSAITGVAQMLQAGLGGWMAHQAEQKQLQREQNTAKAMGAYLAAPSHAEGMKALQAAFEGGNIDTYSLMPVLGAIAQQQYGLRQQGAIGANTFAAFGGPQSGGGGGGGRAAGFTNAGGPAELEPIFASASQRYGLSPHLIKAVAGTESNFNSNATSPAGAGGIMQIMPDTAKGLGVTDVRDPTQNIHGGANYLKQQLVKYNGNINHALAAYNWGPGNVDKWLAAGGDPSKLPAETQNYIATVKARNDALQQGQTSGGGGGGGTGSAYDPGAELEARAQALMQKGDDLSKAQAGQLMQAAFQARQNYNTAMATTRESQQFTAGQAEKAQALTKEEQRQSRIADLNKRYAESPEAKDFQNSAESFRSGLQTIDNIRNDVKNNKPINVIDQKQLITSLAKSMDPNAAITKNQRGETVGIDFTRGVPGYMREYVTKYLSGGSPLTLDDVANVERVMKINQKGMQDSRANVLKGLQGQADQANLNATIGGGVTADFPAEQLTVSEQQQQQAPPTGPTMRPLPPPPTPAPLATGSAPAPLPRQIDTNQLAPSFVNPQPAPPPAPGPAPASQAPTRKAPEVPGYTGTPVMDSNGNFLRWNYVPTDSQQSSQPAPQQ
jgi:soluble lytic murein transglycosylase-like protein